jgi:hypothetical protein
LSTYRRAIIEANKAHTQSEAHGQRQNADKYPEKRPRSQRERYLATELVLPETKAQDGY